MSNDCNYVYVADGFKGLSIIDITDILVPKRMSSIFLGGWAKTAKTTSDERFAFVS
jgi:hypothetical protein